MKILKQRKEIDTQISNFLLFLSKNKIYHERGYTHGESPNRRGSTGKGALRHHIFFGYNENEVQQDLLEVNIPLEYKGKVGSIGGRIAEDDQGNYYLLRSPIGITTSGRIKIQEQVEDRLRNKLVKLDNEDKFCLL